MSAEVLQGSTVTTKGSASAGKPGFCTMARMLMRSGGDITALRRREFSRLDATGSVYLDYAGAALYPASLVKRDAQRLLRRAAAGRLSRQSTQQIIQKSHGRLLRFG